MMKRRLPILLLWLGCCLAAPAAESYTLRDSDRAWINRGLRYMRVTDASAGADWRLRDRLIVSVEGFGKRYGLIPLSTADGSCQPLRQPRRTHCGL